MVKLAILNGLLLELAPLVRVVAVVEVYDGATDKVVTKQHIVIVSLNDYALCTRERHVEVKHLVEARIGLVLLIALSPALHLVAALDDYIWIREGANVSRAEVETLQKIQTCDTLHRSRQLLQHILLALALDERVHELGVVDVQLDEQVLEPRLALLMDQQLQEVLTDSFTSLLEVNAADKVKEPFLEALQCDLLLSSLLLVVYADEALEAADHFLS